MGSYLLFIVAFILIVIIVIAVIQFKRNPDRMKRMVLDLLKIDPEKVPRRPRGPARSTSAWESRDLSEEEMSEAELERLQKLIKSRKKVAWESDISYHVWNLYKSLFKRSEDESFDPLIQGGKWYEIKILNYSSQNGLEEVEFELKGERFKFVDDEEQHGWANQQKFFRLYLYDSEGRCLIEIPMKLRVDKWGRNYSISSDSPKAFLPGDWVSDFVHVTLKHQSVRNREIREQKHKERLHEIEDLKDRFGISD